MTPLDDSIQSIFVGHICSVHEEIPPPPAMQGHSSCQSLEEAAQLSCKAMPIVQKLGSYD